MYVQFEERKVCVAVVCLVFALRLDVVLEYCGRLWVVSVESVENSLNMLWPVSREVEWDTHVVCALYEVVDGAMVVCAGRCCVV